MSILGDLNDLQGQKRALAAKALFHAEQALAERGVKVLEDGDIELAEAIADWSTILTAAAQMFVQGDGPPIAKDAPERIGLLAIAKLYDQSLKAQTDTD